MSLSKQELRILHKDQLQIVERMRRMKLDTSRARLVHCLLSAIPTHGHSLLGVLWCGPKNIYYRLKVKAIRTVMREKGVKRIERTASDVLAPICMSGLPADGLEHVAGLLDLQDYVPNLPTQLCDGINEVADAFSADCGMFLHNPLGNLEKDMKRVNAFANALHCPEVVSAIDPTTVSKDIVNIVAGKLASMGAIAASETGKESNHTHTHTCNVCEEAILDHQQLRYQCITCTERTHSSYDMHTSCLKQSRCYRHQHAMQVWNSAGYGSSVALRVAGVICPGCKQLFEDKYWSCLDCPGWGICRSCRKGKDTDRIHQPGHKSSHHMVYINFWGPNVTSGKAKLGFCDSCMDPFSGPEDNFSCVTCSLFNSHGYNLCRKCLQAGSLCQGHVFKAPFDTPESRVKYHCSDCKRTVPRGGLWRQCTCKLPDGVPGGSFDLCLHCYTKQGRSFRPHRHHRFVLCGYTTP